MIGISAVVATLNRRNELKKLFDSLLLQQVEVLEVIVVDQNQNNLIDDLIDAYSDSLVIKHLKMSVANQSQARNLGASHAVYPIICFPDDDCWFDEGSLHKVQQNFNANSDTDLLIINWKQNPHIHNRSKYLSQREIFSFKSVGYVTYVLFFQTKIFLELGGFLEDVGIGRYIGGGEDSELTFRSIQQKKKIYYDASIVVNHNYIPILSRDAAVIRARQRGMGMVYSKFDIPITGILKGLLAPLVRMIFAFNLKKSKDYYNMFVGRWQGFTYTQKQRKKELPAAINSVSKWTEKIT